MTDRTTLALAACEGLSDAELAERGAMGYMKMRDRKRHYSNAARKLLAGYTIARKMVEERDAEIAKLKATIATLQNLDTPVTDTTAAADMLAALIKKAQ